MKKSNISETDIKNGFITYYNELVNLSLNIVRDQEIAKDILQDTAIKLLDRKGIIYIQTSFYQYIKRMVINASLNHIKASKKLAEIEEIGATIMLANEDPLEASLKNILEKGLESLTPKRKIIFTLYRLEGLDHDEIADYLGVSRKNR